MFTQGLTIAVFASMVLMAKCFTTADYANDYGTSTQYTTSTSRGIENYNIPAIDREFRVFKYPDALTTVVDVDSDAKMEEYFKPCPAHKRRALRTCSLLGSCANRCGSRIFNTPLNASEANRVCLLPNWQSLCKRPLCGCDKWCVIVGDCCWDFPQACPVLYRELKPPHQTPKDDDSSNNNNNNNNRARVDTVCERGYVIISGCRSVNETLNAKMKSEPTDLRQTYITDRQSGLTFKNRTVLTCVQQNFPLASFSRVQNLMTWERVISSDSFIGMTRLRTFFERGKSDSILDGSYVLNVPPSNESPRQCVSRIASHCLKNDQLFCGSTDGIFVSDINYLCEYVNYVNNDVDDIDDNVEAEDLSTRAVTTIMFTHANPMPSTEVTMKTTAIPNNLNGTLDGTMDAETLRGLYCFVSPFESVEEKETTIIDGEGRMVPAYTEIYFVQFGNHWGHNVAREFPEIHVTNHRLGASSNKIDIVVQEVSGEKGDASINGTFEFDGRVDGSTATKIPTLYLYNFKIVCKTGYFLALSKCVKLQPHSLTLYVIAKESILTAHTSQIIPRITEFVKVSGYFIRPSPPFVRIVKINPTAQNNHDTKGISLFTYRIPFVKLINTAYNSSSNLFTQEILRYIFGDDFSQYSNSSASQSASGSVSQLSPLSLYQVYVCFSMGSKKQNYIGCDILTSIPDISVIKHILLKTREVPNWYINQLFMERMQDVNLARSPFKSFSYGFYVFLFVTSSFFHI